jgi:DegV family protein with EDD domain
MSEEAAVVTGSVAQVPTDVAEELGIEIVPLVITVNGKEYLDEINITPGELYQKMRTDQLEVKTAAPTIGGYYEAYKKEMERGVRQIVCIPLSQKMSSDHSSAVNAANLFQADFPEVKVVVIDCRRVYVPQGFICIEAAERLKDGEAFEDVVAYLDAEWPKTGLFAALDTLKYLNAGGRIGKAASLLGSSLHILPVISIASDDGIISPAAVLRRNDKVIPTLIALVKERTAGYKKIRLGVAHADELQRAEELREEFLKVFPGTDIAIDEFTPVMGAHTGPGLLGVGYLYE